MKIRTIFAVLSCKFTRFILRVTGRGGTNLPGKVAVKLYPELLGQLSKNVTTIIVTGTNGKTTTSRMVEQCLIEQGMSYFSNKSGANLLTGITAEFANNSSIFGKNKFEYALIECDEAAFKQVSKFVDAKYIVVTNVFRDQLDRFGDVGVTLKSIGIGIGNSPNAIVCLNADDSLSVSLSEGIKNKIVYYGVETEIYNQRVEEISDARYCIKCQHEYVYDYITYGHLGGYHCPNCGYSKPKTEVFVSKVFSSNEDRSEVELNISGLAYKTSINLPGGYNIYNGVATAAAASSMGIKADVIVESLGKFGGGFGRMEKFTIEDTDIRMILIKNPAGCNQVLNFLSNTQKPSLFVVALNDKLADGTDVSWIWDVDFEKLTKMENKLTKIIVSGVRAEDMAVRFKYAGVPMEKIEVVHDYGELIDKMVNQDAPVYVMPTYTALMELRARISKDYGFKEFWEWVRLKYVIYILIFLI